MDEIDYLIQRRYPREWSIAHRDPMHSGVSGAERARCIALVAQQRQEIWSRASADANAFQEFTAEVKAERAKEALEVESKMPWSLPGAAAAYSYWTKMATWSLDECTALSLGRDPRKVTWGLVSLFGTTSDFPREYADLRRLLMSAKEAGDLVFPVRPTQFVAWAASASISVSIPNTNWPNKSELEADGTFHSAIGASECTQSTDTSSTLPSSRPSFEKKPKVKAKSGRKPTSTELLDRIREAAATLLRKYDVEKVKAGRYPAAKVLANVEFLAAAFPNRAITPAITKDARQFRKIAGLSQREALDRIREASKAIVAT